MERIQQGNRNLRQQSDRAQGLAPQQQNQRAPNIAQQEVYQAPKRQQGPQIQQQAPDAQVCVGRQSKRDYGPRKEKAAQHAARRPNGLGSGEALRRQGQLQQPRSYDGAPRSEQWLRRNFGKEIAARITSGDFDTRAFEEFAAQLTPASARFEAADTERFQAAFPGAKHPKTAQQANLARFVHDLQTFGRDPNATSAAKHTARSVQATINAKSEAAAEILGFMPDAKTFTVLEAALPPGAEGFEEALGRLKAQSDEAGNDLSVPADLRLELAFFGFDAELSDDLVTMAFNLEGRSPREKGASDRIKAWATAEGSTPADQLKALRRLATAASMNGREVRNAKEASALIANLEVLENTEDRQLHAHYGQAFRRSNPMDQAWEVREPARAAAKRDRQRETRAFEKRAGLWS